MSRPPAKVNPIGDTEEVYEFIVDFIHQNRFPPTLREIGEGCYLGRSTVVRHLDRLEAAGRISREPGKARGIVLTDSDNAL